MDRSFVEAVREQGMEIGGRVYAPHGWRDVKTQFQPAALPVTTLAGIRDYLKSNVDKLDPSTLLINVVDPTTVHVYRAIEGEEQQFRRALYMTSRAVVPALAFDSFVDSEVFSVVLASRFVQSDARDSLVVMLRSIRENQVKETIDSGLAQEVNVQKGIALTGNVKVPSPVKLAPFRTFSEVAQPESEFIVRLKAGRGGEDGRPEVALFEADGGRWRLDAIASVAEWLRREIPEANVVA